MHAAVDSPKSKQITIAYQSLKITGLSWVLLHTLTEHTHRCQEAHESQLYSLFILFYKLGFILDVVSTLYFLLNDAFSRLEYYVYICIHAIAMVAMGFGLLLIQEGEFEDSCGEFGWLRAGCFWGRVGFFGVAVGLMAGDLMFGFKWVHCGANPVWVILWLLQGNYGETSMRVITGSHVMVATLSALFLLITESIGKTSTSATMWRVILKVNLAVLLLCWIYSALHKTELIFINAYIKYGLVQLVSPVLYLTFLNVEQGDPREFIMETCDFQGMI